MMTRNYAESSHEVSDFDHLDLSALGAVAERGVQLLVQIAESEVPVPTEALVSPGETTRQVRRSLELYSGAALIRSARGGWRATGAGRAAARRARRPRKGER